VSAIEKDNVLRESYNTEALGSNFNLTLSADDVTLIKYVCSLLTHRATLLVGAVLAALLRRMERPSTSIAVTGSLYKHHPRFKTLLEMYTAAYASGYKFETFLSDDGSGKGAGLVAAIADRISKKAK